VALPRHTNHERELEGSEPAKISHDIHVLRYRFSEANPRVKQPLVFIYAEARPQRELLSEEVGDGRYHIIQRVGLLVHGLEGTRHVIRH